MKMRTVGVGGQGCALELVAQECKHGGTKAIESFPVRHIPNVLKLNQSGVRNTLLCVFA
jgi:hypothetical protein